MTASDIICLPDPRLRQKSKKVGFVDSQIRKTIDDMVSATLDWEDSRQHELGVALAGVQIGCMQKIVIIRNNFEDRDDRSFQIFLNPRIIKYEGAIEEDYEGCLSIKNIYGKVPRYTKVKVKAQDTKGQEIKLTAEGFMARIFQHEIDHTKGVVFIDHIKENKNNFFTLKEDGSLESLDYENIKTDNILWC